MIIKNPIKIIETYQTVKSHCAMNCANYFPLPFLTQLADNRYMKDWNPEEIRQLREDHKLSQRALSELLGVARNYIYYLERGEREPSKTLRLLLDCVEEKLNRK